MCLKSDLLPFNFTICQRRNKLAPDTKHYMAFTVLGIEDASIQNTQTPYHYTKSLMKKREFFSLKFIQIYLLFYMYCLFLFPWFLIEKKKTLQNFKRLDKQDDVGANRISQTGVSNSYTTWHSYQQCTRFPFLYILANVVISCFVLFHFFFLKPS